MGVACSTFNTACPDGSKCNTALANPACQSTFCAALGTPCSADVLCASGGTCKDDVCTALGAEGAACANDLDCGGLFICSESACRSAGLIDIRWVILSGTCESLGIVSMRITVLDQAAAPTTQTSGPCAGGQVAVRLLPGTYAVRLESLRGGTARVIHERIITDIAVIGSDTAQVDFQL